MPTEPGLDDLLRVLTPQVLGVLVRRYGQFDACEDAVQEALLDAARQWPLELPEHPYGWLLTVARRRLIDHWRSDQARRRRELTAAALIPDDETFAADPAADAPPLAPDQDDTLTLLFLCCHRALSPASQVALTLRAVGGLTTAQIANAFLVPEATMAQRISRAKQKIKSAGSTFGSLSPADRPARLGAVLHVLYLILNEGYIATSGPELQQAELSCEAIRLTRVVHHLLPDDGEVAGLLALMLLTDARKPARTTPDGALIPLAEQDRSRWDAGQIQEGIALVSDALARTTLGPYQLQAAIAAVHSEAAGAAETDWPQVLALYGLLDRIAPNPIVTLNRAVALAMVHGPHAGLRLLSTLDDDDRLAGHHRLDAVRGHLLELAGEWPAAVTAYGRAAARTGSVPEQRYLSARAARLTAAGDAPHGAAGHSF